MIKEYKHSQIGYFLLIVYSVVIMGMVYLNIVTEFSPIAQFGLIIMFIVLALFATLKVKVDHKMIQIRFGVGAIRKGFRLNKIENYRVVKNPWYYGWGIRFTPRGWLFNVSGFSAIELQMKNGKRFRIGTDDPKGLAKAVDEALNVALIR